MGIIAEAGTRPGIRAISNIPPPIPIIAARQEVKKTMGISTKSITEVSIAD
jgi:hypothetical protein